MVQDAQSALLAVLPAVSVAEAGIEPATSG